MAFPRSLSRNYFLLLTAVAWWYAKAQTLEITDPSQECSVVTDGIECDLSFNIASEEDTVLLEVQVQCESGLQNPPNFRQASNCACEAQITDSLGASTTCPCAVCPAEWGSWPISVDCSVQGSNATILDECQTLDCNAQCGGPCALDCLKSGQDCTFCSALSTSNQTQDIESILYFCNFTNTTGNIFENEWDIVEDCLSEYEPCVDLSAVDIDGQSDLYKCYLNPLTTLDECFGETAQCIGELIIVQDAFASLPECVLETGLAVAQCFYDNIESCQESCGAEIWPYPFDNFFLETNSTCEGIVEGVLPPICDVAQCCPACIDELEVAAQCIVNDYLGLELPCAVECPADTELIRRQLQESSQENLTSGIQVFADCVSKGISPGSSFIDCVGEGIIDGFRNNPLTPTPSPSNITDTNSTFSPTMSPTNETDTNNTFAPTSSPTKKICDICGGAGGVGDGDAQIRLLPQFNPWGDEAINTTCAEFQAAGLAGEIDEKVCPLIPAFAKEVCVCGGGNSTPAPTVAPTNATIYPSCDICGGSGPVTNPLFMIEIPVDLIPPGMDLPGDNTTGDNTTSFTCEAIKEFAINGAVPPDLCPLLVSFLSEPCGCGKPEETEVPTQSPTTAAPTSDFETFPFVNLVMHVEGAGALSESAKEGFSDAVEELYLSYYNSSNPQRKRRTRRRLQADSQISNVGTEVIVTKDTPEGTGVFVTYDQSLMVALSSGEIDGNTKNDLLAAPLAGNGRDKLIALLKKEDPSFENVTSVEVDLFPSDDGDDSIDIVILLVIVFAGLCFCCPVMYCIYQKYCSQGVGGKWAAGRQDTTQEPIMGSSDAYDTRPINAETFQDEGGFGPEEGFNKSNSNGNNNDSFIEDYHMSGMTYGGNLSGPVQANEDDGSSEDEEEEDEDDDESSSDDDSSSSDDEDEDSSSEEGSDQQESEASSSSEEVNSSFA